jgi:EmrB/QacA subfamily drug resistance transporter
MVGLLLGFFMILLDTTIVVTALPRMMTKLDADLNEGVWITSAYLLTYAVPLLVSGRLGDRFGAKNIFMIGLVLFVGSSLWCGLSPTVGWLIAARAVQGLGAALLSPQSMTLITRMFPPERRGAPMAIWGATAGVATLAGPLLGGVLVDALGWEWIFFVNLPVGVLCFIMVAVWVPKLPVHSHHFDLFGVFLSAAGMFLVVFGIQQGESRNWGTLWGPFTAWEFILTGIVVLCIFVWWQAHSKEPLLPLGLFRSRNVALANVTATCMGMAVTTFGLPVVLYLQTVEGFTPTQAALCMAPMSVVSILVAPLAGSLVSRVDSKWMAAPGFAVFSAGMFAAAWCVHHQSPLIWLLLASAVMGVGSAAVWPSISLTNNRDLTQADAGAGSGVFNTTRQVGAVIGSAVIAWVMQARIQAESTAAVSGLPSEARAKLGQHASAAGASGGSQIPDFLHQAFSSAYGIAVLVPACAALLGAIVALCFAPRASTMAEAAQRAQEEAAHGTR